MRGPFVDLSRVQRNKLFNLLGVHIYNFKKNEEILPTIKNENIVSIILEGMAQIKYIEYNGNEIILENLCKDDVFGSNISATNSDSCQIISKSDTKVLVIDYANILNPKNIKYSYFNIFITNLFDIINIKMREKNDRIKILEKKQLREKLLEYFEIEYKKCHSKEITIPFSLKDLSDYIASNRSAMFRELKNMKEENLIQIKDRKITLLYK